MPCGFGQRGVLARPIVSVLLVGGGVVGHGAGVSCRASPSRLICSSRAVGRGVSFLVSGSISWACRHR